MNEISAYQKGYENATNYAIKTLEQMVNEKFKEKE
jgi:hypothetical protein